MVKRRKQSGIKGRGGPVVSAGAGSRPRVWLLANGRKTAVAQALAEFRQWLADRAEVVAEPDMMRLTAGEVKKLPEADVAVVLGGDGTVLDAGRRLLERQVPILGINFGKLGFLAEFNVSDLQQYWSSLVRSGFAAEARVTMGVRVYRCSVGQGWIDGRTAGNVEEEFVSLNDAVVTAGAPFRMIEVELVADRRDLAAEATVISGDGVIVATAGGSTAYNLSADGPILSPELGALCVTPICSHSLAFRPIVVSAESGVYLRVCRPNPGTTLVIDGEQHLRLRPGWQVLIGRHKTPLYLVRHPHRSHWQTLAKKMLWAVRPRSG